MAAGLSVELMTPGDLAAVAAIEQASFSEPWPLESFQTELDHNQLATYMVARLNDRTVAYLGSWFVLDEAHITTLAVVKDCRRRGIADRLVQNLVDLSLARGVRLVTLEVRPSNSSARQLYLKHGFRVEGLRRSYYRDEDALVMSLRLTGKEAKDEAGVTGTDR